MPLSAFTLVRTYFTETWLPGCDARAHMPYGSGASLRSSIAAQGWLIEAVRSARAGHQIASQAPPICRSPVPAKATGTWNPKLDAHPWGDAGEFRLSAKSGRASRHAR